MVGRKNPVTGLVREERGGFSSVRPLAVILVLVTTLIAGGSSLTFSFARLYLEAKELLVDLPERLVALAREAERLFFQVQERLQLPEGFWEQSWLRPESLMETAGGLLQDFLQSLLNLFRGFPIFLINLFLSGLAAYFFSRDKEKLSAFLVSLLPQEWREPARRLQGAVVLSTLNFLKIQIMLATITGLVTTFLGLFGFARPGLLGVLTGILDLLPMVGPTTLFLPWAGWNFAVGDFLRALLIIGILLVILAMRTLRTAFTRKETGFASFIRSFLCLPGFPAFWRLRALCRPGGLCHVTLFLLRSSPLVGAGGESLTGQR